MAPLVLLVEDDEHFSHRLQELLELEGFEVERVCDGVEALSRLSQGLVPAAIVTDLTMPRMDGLQLAHELAASPTLARIPLIVLTAWHTPVGLERVEVLLKPRDVLRVAEKLRQALAS